MMLSAFALAALIWHTTASADTPVTRFVGPTSSQPLALTADGGFLVVANPDNNSVTFFDVREDANKRLARVPVQKEPWGVAFLPDGSKAYAAHTVSGTVSVIQTNLLKSGIIPLPYKHIDVGTEPYGLVLTPNGRKLYVSNARSNDISVIDTATDTVIRTIKGVGFELRGLAITNDGDGNDVDETLYVTQFLSLPIAGRVDGQDNSKAGHVAVISVFADAVIKDVVINPIDDTGFKAAGNAIDRIPPGPNFVFTTGAYPNQLNNAAILGNYVYLPNTGASPNGPVRFNVNTQSLLAVIKRATNTDAGLTINMHSAVGQQTNPDKLFITQPWAMAFKHNASQGYVVSAASNILVKIAVEASTGSPSVLNDPLDPTRVLEVKLGKNPRGIVVNPVDTRAYIMNYVGRDVSVVDLTGPKESVVAKLQSAELPMPGTFEDKVHAGKELYNTSVGEFDPPTSGQPPLTGRMSNSGWGACAACHPNALSDNVVWIFPPGPRRTIPQHTDFDLADPDRKAMRPLNWTANRDEQEDFEGNIRAVSGGPGLIVLADGVTPDPNVQDFLPLANANRNQVKIRGVGGWDALKAFVKFGIRAPISPVSKNDQDVIAGQKLFVSANCQSCHGTANWSVARVPYTPPPDPALIVNTEIISELRKVGTFDPNALNEVRQNALSPLGADGFVPPTLLSIFAFPQTFFHNGIATSLEQVMNNVTHRSAGTGGVDTLTNAAARAAVIRFLLSIDAATPPINP